MYGRPGFGELHAGMQVVLHDREGGEIVSTTYAKVGQRNAQSYLESYHTSDPNSNPNPSSIPYLSPHPSPHPSPNL